MQWASTKTASRAQAFEVQIGTTAAGYCLVVEQLQVLHPSKFPRGQARWSNGGNNDAVGRHGSKAQPRSGLRPAKLPSRQAITSSEPTTTSFYSLFCSSSSSSSGSHSPLNRQLFAGSRRAKLPSGRMPSAVQTTSASAACAWIAVVVATLRGVNAEGTQRSCR